jgi:hypothetical protein
MAVAAVAAVLAQTVEQVERGAMVLLREAVRQELLVQTMVLAAAVEAVPKMGLVPLVAMEPQASSSLRISRI